MKRLFEKILPGLLWIAVAALTARLIAAGIEIFLPPLPHTECLNEPKTERTDYPFARAFGLKTTQKKPTTRPRNRPVRRVSLSGYTLTMTAVGHPSMAIVVKGGKSKLLTVGESIDGFRLEKVETDRIELSKNGTRYWLTMKKKSPHTAAYNRPERTKKSASDYAEQIRQEGDTYYIPRELLEEFRDVKKIFKYISIKPIYKSNKLIGFGVSNVKKGSVFAKMGLRKRDIIQKINGEELTSETQAFKYFNKINELSSLTMTIKRGSEEKELHYEIF